jgi:ABC-type multidrug transport system fused ATPase/permease subunit
LRGSNPYRTQNGSHPNCAVLVIAHRLAIVRHADRIVVPEDGRPVASGRHNELSVTSPVYREPAATRVLHPRSDGS